uniref:Serine-type D-Ala-D-Ala carboxypeptidase n=1 Tax=Cyanothece sp. (strain PCC 7425 / ATCC 29141) TaxID=395961 RepID=B8HYD9_CYAP4
MKIFLSFKYLCIVAIVALGVTLLSWLPILAQPPVAKPLDAQLRPVMTQWLKQHPELPGAVVGVWLKGYEPWQATFGMGNLKTQTPMQLTDHFRIGSNTKTFTGTVLLQLVDEGKLGLDDKAAQYLPEITQLPNGKGGEITIRQVGNHTSGIFDYSKADSFQAAYGNNTSKYFSPQQLLTIALQNKPYFYPGQGWEYSNSNTLILGLIIERLTGNSIATEIQNRILNPLGMTQTSFPTTPAMPTPYAHGYFYSEPSDQNPPDASNWNPSWAWAAGQMISTLEDLYRYAKPLATGQLLSPKMQAERLQWAPQSQQWFSAAVQHFLPPGSTVDYKYGFQIMDMNGGIGHAGNVPGYNTFFSYIPDREATVIILTNAQQVPDLQKKQLISPVYSMAQLIFDQLNQLPQPSESRSSST